MVEKGITREYHGGFVSTRGTISTKHKGIDMTALQAAQAQPFAVQPTSAQIERFNSFAKRKGIVIGGNKASKSGMHYRINSVADYDNGLLNATLIVHGREQQGAVVNIDDF